MVSENNLCPDIYKPYLQQISMSLIGAFKAYQKAKVDKDSVYQELYRIRKIIKKKKKLRIDHFEKELALDKDDRTLVDNRHVLAL